MKIRFLNLIIAIIVSFCLTAPLRAQWQPPEDKKLTEKQVQTYVGAMKEIRQMWEEQGKKIDKSATGFGALHAAAQVDDKYKAILSKHNVSEEEWNWIMEQATQAFFIGVSGNRRTPSFFVCERRPS